jgi:hypothetical protein
MADLHGAFGRLASDSIAADVVAKRTTLPSWFVGNPEFHQDATLRACAHRDFTAEQALLVVKFERDRAQTELMKAIERFDTPPVYRVKP